MRNVFVLIGLFATVNGMAFGQDEVRILFEATIDKDDGALVYSGPGNQYYATSKLQKGERVKVFRKDADGWLMIAPPRGSFSWISAADFGLGTDLYREYIHERGTSQVTSNRVDVHAGSELDPEAISTISAHLHKGDAVRILGTHQFALDNGPQEMMKIQPVRGEWRWIHRDSIASADNLPSEYRSRHLSDHQPDQISDPQPVPARRKRRHAGEDSSAAVAVREDSLDFTADTGTSRRSDHPHHPGRARLLTIDRQFREMIQLEAVTWNLDALESQYVQLGEEIGDSSLSVMIDVRLDAVKRYRTYYAEYLDFVRLTAETRRRDAELVARQSLYQTTLQPYPNQFAVTAAAGIQTPPQYQLALQTRTASPSFDGAGIVRRLPETTAAGPQYALVAPDGRTLSYLQSTPGIDLSQYEGRPMGITGLRYFRRDWNADTIAVRDLQPVQLQRYR